MGSRQSTCFQYTELDTRIHTATDTVRDLPGSSPSRGRVKTKLESTWDPLAVLFVCEGDVHVPLRQECLPAVCQRGRSLHLAA